MLDEKYSSKEWDTLWKELDTIKSPPTFNQQQNKSYKFQHSKLRTGDFGMGASMMANYQDPIQGLQADVRKGAGHIEFSPSLNGQGMKSFSKVSAEKRRALREIKKANDVTIGTHADANVTGLTGFDSQRFSFDENRRHESISKIKEAIDFAADVSEGGAITFHAGDFLRPVAGTTWSNGEKFGQGRENKIDMVLGVIDSSTNNLVKESMVNIDDRLTVPVLYDSANDQDVDFGGFTGKLPGFELMTKEDGSEEIDTRKLNSFKQYTGWLLETNKDFQKEVNKLNLDTSKMLVKSNDEDAKGSDFTKEVSDYRLLELAAKHKFNSDQKFELFNQVTRTMGQVGRQKFEVSSLNKNIEKAKALSSSKNDVVYVSKDLMRSGSPMTETQILAGMRRQDPETKDEDFIEHVEEMIRIEDGEVKGVGKSEVKTESHITVNGYQSGDFKLSESENVEHQFDLLKKNYLNQLEDKYDKVTSGDYKTISEVAKTQNEKSFSELGAVLNEKNKVLKKQGKDQLYFAIENIFPEHYGSNPEELLEIIRTAQGAMKDELIRENYSESKAKEISENSIKATFDTGHLHMWKKYFKRNSKESDDSYNTRFNKWALGETKKLIDAKVIGNVHLADNFGHEDDHLTLGQGTVPIDEYMRMFDRARADGDMIGKFSVEGFDESGERNGVLEAWKQSGVQVFRSQEATDKWVNMDDDIGSGYGFGSVSDSYLRAGNKPYFIFGGYAPAQDPNDWAPWDEMGLE